MHSSGLLVQAMLERTRFPSDQKIYSTNGLQEAIGRSARGGLPSELVVPRRTSLPRNDVLNSKFIKNFVESQM